MTYSLTWLPNVLLDAGLKVAEVPGWRERGAGDMGPIFGVLCHHTAGPRSGNMPSLGVIRDGRPAIGGQPALRGPLSQLGLGRDGTYYVIGAGKANHAGPGTWKGATGGNDRFIGIEAENTGYTTGPRAETWPDVQMDAYRRGVAAILRYTGLGADRCAGHKEYATPRGRKIDPTFDMAAFRAGVAELMGGAPAAPALIPANETPKSSGAAVRPTLRRGSSAPQVDVLRKALGLGPAGQFDAQTEARAREFQRRSGLVPDGIFGPKSWTALDESGLVPPA